MAPMGSNFGDVDNDGFLDLYLGTGDMSYEGLDPNLMFKNVEGAVFEDVTASSGTGHLQKGHGVSFADFDNDGDLDLFVELGGATPGDQGYNALFKNPGHGRHWLKVKLVGTKTNRAALGAGIRVDRKAGDGPPARSTAPSATIRASAATASSRPSASSTRPASRESRSPGRRAEPRRPFATSASTRRSRSPRAPTRSRSSPERQPGRSGPDALAWAASMRFRTYTRSPIA